MTIKRTVAALVCVASFASGCSQYSWVEIDRRPAVARPTRVEAPTSDTSTGVLYNLVALGPEVAKAVIKEAARDQDATVTTRITDATEAGDSVE